jgi:signal transduction histidine kinase
VRRPALVLTLIACLSFFVGLGYPAISDSDEGFYAEAAREMVEGGDWLTPHFNYEERWQKPILYYWLTAATYVVAGPNEWTARWWSAISGLGLVLLTWAIARRMLAGSEAAWLAGAIVATCYGYFTMARCALPDLPLTFFITLTIWAGLDRRWALSGAAASAGSLVRILNDILEMTRIEAGMLSIEKKPFSLRDCVSGVVEIFTAEARRKELNLVLSVADDLPETVLGDQLRLRQVLTNLVGNAFKFTERGRVVLKVEALSAIPSGKPREVTFTVTDTGIGIPEDKKPLIFRPFSQVDDSHSRSYGGTGLGLVISKEIVERMGGTIVFVSKEGMGCSFIVTVPFGDPGSEPNSETGDANPKEKN